MIGGVTDNDDSLGGNNSGCAARQLAMVYAPHQCWRMLYSPENALVRGTLFEELDKPLEDCVNG
ncbi:MAG: spore coat associated protein CotJA [Ruminococcaceae bacterium]|nr:spore coat associated protein CotJA [Oscillospiraceae bacterium]